MTFTHTSAGQQASLCCRFEDYVGQLEAATAVAGLSVEKERAPAVKDRKELAAIQEVQLVSCLFQRLSGKTTSVVNIMLQTIRLSPLGWAALTEVVASSCSLFRSQHIS